MLAAGPYPPGRRAVPDGVAGDAGGQPHWTAHGISIGQLPQILTSALSLCCAVPSCI